MTSRVQLEAYSFWSVEKDRVVLMGLPLSDICNLRDVGFLANHVSQVWILQSIQKIISPNGFAESVDRESRLIASLYTTELHFRFEMANWEDYNYFMGSASSDGILRRTCDNRYKTKITHPLWLNRIKVYLTDMVKKEWTVLNILQRRKKATSSEYVSHALQKMQVLKISLHIDRLRY